MARITGKIAREGRETWESRMGTRPYHGATLLGVQTRYRATDIDFIDHF